MFVKFLKKDKITPYVLARLNTLDILCCYNLREFRENQCSEHKAYKVCKGNYYVFMF